ncbi:MAG: hypothetical protein GXY13_15330 [Acidimicrobiales bacterium]|nr:hypothetical protein [Acidimicrobiales bacterium]
MPATDDRAPTGRALPDLSRRSLLRGAAALGVVGTAGGFGLTACGSGDDGRASDGPGATLTPGGEGLEPSWSLVSMTDTASSVAAGSEARVAFGVAEPSGGLVVDAPAELEFRVVDDGGAEVVGGLAVARHDRGLPRAYYPVRFTPPAAGIYTAYTEVEGTEIEASFQVSDAGDIVVPQAGQAFPATTTPTGGAPGGVDPICTRDPECGLHEVDVATAVGTAPLAILVSTPAFCTAAICGPVLDVLLGAREAAPHVTFVHVEVYASAEEVGEAGPGNATLAPAVDAWKLPYEPCLFLVGSDGTLHRRLDVIFDGDELAEALADLA